MQATAAAKARQAGGEFTAKNSVRARTITATVGLLLMVFHQFTCKTSPLTNTRNNKIIMPQDMALDKR